MPATIEIDVQGRWNAVALMRRLDPYHSYLVQLTPEHWIVHAGCPGCHGERLPGALAAIGESLAARHLEDAQVRVNGRRYLALPARQRRKALTEPASMSTQQASGRVSGGA